MHRRHEHGNPTTFASFQNERLKICFVGREGADSFALFFLVVVPVLNEQVVAGFHRAQNFVEPMRANELRRRLAGLSVIRNRHRQA